MFSCQHATEAEKLSNQGAAVGNRVEVRLIREFQGRRDIERQARVSGEARRETHGYSRLVFGLESVGVLAIEVVHDRRGLGETTVGGDIVHQRLDQTEGLLIGLRVCASHVPAMTFNQVGIDLAVRMELSGGPSRGPSPDPPRLEEHDFPDLLAQEQCGGYTGDAPTDHNHVADLWTNEWSFAGARV